MSLSKCRKSLALFLTVLFCTCVVQGAKKPNKKLIKENPSKLKNVTDTTYTKNLETIDFIAGKKNKKAYYPRAMAIKRLGKNLTRREVDSIYKFLSHGTAANLKPLEINSLKNDLVIVLMKQTRPPIDLGFKLVEMFNNKKNSSIWRDYCVQFMGRWYKKATTEEQKQMKKAISSALDEHKNGIAGAALIALRSNIGQGEIKPREVRIAAFKVLTAKDTPDYLKLTALQVCAMSKETKVLPIARQILKTSKHVPLKMSAIAAIGILGDGDDVENLNKLAHSTDIRLRIAATSALKKLGFKKKKI
jgi:HEAT repeats